MIKSPFTYFGGKSTVAPLVWSRLGDTPNYVEPFFGSGAMLLARPDGHSWWERVETVNDLDGMISNFWRAVQQAPDEVVKWADWPINENDLHARHAWLVCQKESLQTKLEGDASYFDAKVAGWWVWGICQWIGSGWCSGNGPWHQVDGELVNTRTDGSGAMRQLPHLGGAGRGINRKLPHLGGAGQGINRKRPHLGGAGKGINRKRHRLGGWSGTGVHAMPDGLEASQCQTWTVHLQNIMQRLSDRLRRVRVCCGDWSRICGPTPTVKQGLTGVFLDPPYAQNQRDSNLYTVETEISADVRKWAIEQGNDPLLRIALCGYEGEHVMPDDWECVAWKARGGYGSQSVNGANTNATRERIWFSPNCLKATLSQSVMPLEIALDHNRQEGSLNERT